MNAKSKREKEAAKQRHSAQATDNAADNGEKPSGCPNPELAALNAAITNFYSEYKKNEAKKAGESQPFINISRSQVREAKNLNWITGVGAFFSFIGLILVSCGISATREATVDSNRAIISVKNPSVTIKNVTVPGGKEVWKINYSADPTNVGKSIASHVFFSERRISKIIPAQAYSEPDKAIQIPVNDFDVCERRKDSYRDPVFFPDDKSIYNYFYPEDWNAALNPSEWESIKSGESIFYFSDCITYESLGNRYKTAFCFAAGRNAFGDIQVFKCETNTHAT